VPATQPYHRPLIRPGRGGGEAHCSFSAAATIALMCDEPPLCPRAAMVAKVESARGDSNDGRTGGRAVRGSAGGCEDSAGNREEDRQARAESRRRYRGTGRAAPRRGICAPRHRAAENKGPIAGTGERANGRHSRFCADQILVSPPSRHLGRLPMRGPLLPTEGVWRVLQKGQ
jgi:hypothetical protein